MRYVTRTQLETFTQRVYLAIARAIDLFLATERISSAALALPSRCVVFTNCLVFFQILGILIGGLIDEWLAVGT